MDINELKETDEAKAQVSRMEKLLETVTKRAGPEGKAPVNLFRLLLHPTSFSQVGHAGLQPPDQQSPDQQSPGRPATHTRGPYSHTWALLTRSLALRRRSRTSLTSAS